MAGRFRVGTSGWSYGHWRGVFYPEKLPAREWLGFYVQHFDTVEINNTFYRLPDQATFRTWREAAPPGFSFALKASRYLTHLKRLLDPEKPLKLLLDGARLLGDKLGPVLFQLPPHWKSNSARLEALLHFLPPGLRFAFEFRDPSWFSEEVRGLLERHGASFCIYHLVGVACPAWVTAPFVYLRFHGTAGRYGGSYPGRELTRWAERIRGWLDEGRDVYAYFNNDLGGHAVRNGRELAERVEAEASVGKES